MCPRRVHPLLLLATCWGLFAADSPGRAGDRLSLRRAGKRLPVPADAVRVFTHEGWPTALHVTRDAIVLEYAHSGVVLDRTTGKLKQRLTATDGWPTVRPAPFDPQLEPPPFTLVGPGVVDDSWTKNKAPLEVVSAKYDGRTWRATQPRQFLRDLMRRNDFATVRQKFGAWTPILRKLNEECALEASARPGQPARRYTVKDGLAGNIVTHLAVAKDTLWAACVDIFDPEKGEWGAGGLCRFDAERGRWQRVRIDGRPVRWVTLLQTVGDELWVGYREGTGVAGDRVAYGKGLYPDHYRPRTDAVVLARLKGGKWTRFARPPRLDEPGWPRAGRDATKNPSTEVPRRLARVGNQVLLFSTTATNHASGNWQVPLAGAVSLLELDGPRWRLFDSLKDLDADDLVDMVAGEGEVLVASNRAAHRWDAARKTWRKLDTEAPLVNPAVSAVAAVGDELWVGYTNQSFGVIGEQGISRYDERTGKWSRLSPQTLGTAAPVKSLRVAPDGDVWMLFGPRPRGGSAVEYPFYPREAKRPRGVGLGRFHKGKWAFPAHLDGVADAVEVEATAPDRKVGKRKRPLPVKGLAVVGNAVFVAHDAGVYRGPGKWRRILEGPTWALGASPDGKALTAVRQDPKRPRESVAFQRGVFNVAAGKWTFTDLDAAAAARRMNGMQEELSDGGQAVIRTATHGTWVLSLPGNERLRVVETPRAYWVVSRGQLVRLDRARLAALLAKQ